MAFKRLELESLLVEVENPNFIPCPRISLLLDAANLGHCGICHESQLLLRSQKKALDDRTVAILPCGHIAGYKCLKEWFSFDRSCPFCRMKLEYELCTHSSRLIRPLTRENLFSTPETIPVGGRVQPQCFECSIKTNARVHRDLLKDKLQRFKTLRSEYQREVDETKKVEIKLKLLSYKKRIDEAIDESADYPILARTRW